MSATLRVGSHINPAVTLALAVVGRMVWIKVPVYLLGQYLGAFFGASCVYLVYYGLLPQYWSLLAYFIFVWSFVLFHEYDIVPQIITPFMINQNI